MPDSAITNAPRRQVGDEIDVPDLYAALRELLAQIPAGRVTTYGALAEALGAVTAARWVASYLLDPDGPDDLPRHRVILRDGALGKFRGGDLREKVRLLTEEGVSVKNNVVDLAKYNFREFASSRPLFELQQVQERLLSHLQLRPPASFPELVAGVDVSYARKSNAGPVEAVAAYALVEVGTGTIVWSVTVRDVVHVPYIPGFLAFRELPILLKLLEVVRDEGRIAEVVMVDGNGILHERHAGIASHLGIVASLPTIGVGKSLLCGKVNSSCPDGNGILPIVFHGETIANAIQNGPGARPVFVSPGNLVDLSYATELTRRLFRYHRVPEPIFHAHTISRAAVRAR